MVPLVGGGGGGGGGREGGAYICRTVKGESSKIRSGILVKSVNTAFMPTLWQVLCFVLRMWTRWEWNSTSHDDLSKRNAKKGRSIGSKRKRKSRRHTQIRNTENI